MVVYLDTRILGQQRRYGGGGVRYHDTIQYATHRHPSNSQCLPQVRSRIVPRLTAHLPETGAGLACACLTTDVPVRGGWFDFWRVLWAGIKRLIVLIL